MQKNMIIVVVVAFLVGTGAGYAGSHAFARPDAFAQQGDTAMFARNGMNATRRGMFGGNGMLTGTVTQNANGNLTLNTRDGSSHVVLLNASTTVSKSVAGSLSDIAAGTNVIISGTPNSDGSISASFVQLRPAGIGFQNGPMIPATR